MPRNTFTRPSIPSCGRSSPGRIGVGVTSTKSNWILPKNPRTDALRDPGRMPALLRGWSFGQRQPDLKTSVTGPGIHLNTASVLLPKPRHRVQADSGSFSDSLGCEEG